MRSKIYFAIVFAITLGFAIFTQNDFSRFMIGFEFLLELALIIISGILNRFVEKRIIPPSPQALRNSDIPVDFKLKNRSDFPVSEIKVFIKCTDEYTNKSQKLRGTAMLSGKDETIFRFILNSKHYGLIKVTPQKIRISDPLGINYSSSRFLKQAWEIAVLPRTGRIKLGQTPDSKEEIPGDDGDSFFRRSNDISENYELRAYQSGEPLRNIHWKMTAKTGELMVKDYGKETELTGIVFLDLNDYGKPYSRDEWDHFLETVCGYASEKVYAEERLEMIWLDEKSQLCKSQIDSESDIRDALTILLRQKHHSGSDGEIAYKEKLIHETYNAPACIDLWGKITEEETSQQRT